jgi:hypothetical protein
VNLVHTPSGRRGALQTWALQAGTWWALVLVGGRFESWPSAECEPAPPGRPKGRREPVEVEE